MKLLEPVWFGATHAELGSLLINFGALLRPIEKAICFYPYPERLKRIDRDLYQLSSVLSLSATLAQAGKKKPRLEPYQSRWLIANKIGDDTLQSALAAALKAK